MDGFVRKMLKLNLLLLHPFIGISQFSGIDFMFNANNTKIRPKTKKVQKSTKELKGRQREAHRML